MYLLGIQQWIWEAVNSIWFMLCDWIYSFISFLYQVFMKIASVNLFSTEVFKEITGRIYVVIGIVMLFIFAYNLVLFIVNPDDKKGSGAMGKVVKETIISLVVVVLLPTIFNYMYIFQNHILESNIIGQIIMGGSVNTAGRDPSLCESDDFACKCDYSEFTELDTIQYDKGFWDEVLDFAAGFLTIGLWDAIPDDQVVGGIKILEETCNVYRGYKPTANGRYVTDSDRGAYAIAPLIFSSFYRPTGFSLDQCEQKLIEKPTDSSMLLSVLLEPHNLDICRRYYFYYNLAIYTGNFGVFTQDSLLTNVIADPDDNSMEFNWPLAIVAGILGVWMFICYTMEIGVRVAKLGVLQIISPVAVMMRIIPGQKEKIFDKWFKNIKETYIDVFIRLAIIFFSLFAISLVPDIITTLWQSNANGSGSSDLVGDTLIKTLSLVVIILGILKFAQEAPNLIKDFFGDSGKFSLKSPKKQLSENKLAMGGIGMAGGLAKTGVGNFIRARNNKLNSLPENKRKPLSGIGTGLRHGLGGIIAGGYRGFKEGYKTNDIANIGDSINSAKAVSDKGYVKRESKRILRENDAEKFMSKHGIEDVGLNKTLIAGTYGRYRALGRGYNNMVEDIKSWGGSSAFDDVTVKANQAVKDKQSKLASRLDTKGNVSGVTEAREELKKKIATRELTVKDLVTRGFLQEYEGKYYDKDVTDFSKATAIDEFDTIAIEGAIHKAFSNTVDKGRASALMNAKDLDLKEWQQSIENLTQSLKENSDFLENFTGRDGFLYKIGEDFKENIEFEKSEFKKAFSGSIEDFNKGLTDYLAKPEEWRKDSKNEEIARAFAVAIDKIGSTNDANIRMANNKNVDKK